MRIRVPTRPRARPQSKKVKRLTSRMVALASQCACAVGALLPSLRAAWARALPPQSHGALGELAQVGRDLEALNADLLGKLPAIAVYTCVKNLEELGALEWNAPGGTPSAPMAEVISKITQLHKVRVCVCLRACGGGGSFGARARARHNARASACAAAASGAAARAFRGGHARRVREGRGSRERAAAAGVRACVGGVTERHWAGAVRHAAKAARGPRVTPRHRAGLWGT